MLTPLVILAVLSVIGGWVGVPAVLHGHAEFEHFLYPVFYTHTEFIVKVLPPSESIESSHGAELALAAVSVLTALLGFAAAYLFYFRKPGTLGQKAAGNPLYRLVAHKYYIDELYHVAIVTPVLVVSRLLLGGLVETGIVSGSGSFAAFLTRTASSGTRRMQSGNIRSYAGWLAAGAAVVILVMTWTVLTAHAATR